MEIDETQVFHGPNIYCHKPVVKMRVHLKEFVDVPTKEIKGFNDQILSFFPGLRNHECSRGHKGGFIERLEEGTYLAHTAEHLCLEIQNVLGFPVRYGKSRCIEGDCYDIIFAHGHPKVGEICGSFIIRMINDISKGGIFPFEEEFTALKALVNDLILGPSTKAIVEGAQIRGIPIQEIGDSGVVRLGYGVNQRLISASLFERTSSISVEIACDKELTKHFLREQSIPAPKGKIVTSLEEAVREAKQIGYPVVLKPKGGNQGKGVFLRISSDEEIEWTFPKVKMLDDAVIMEEQIEGKDYRLLVINGRFTAAAERVPAHVIGNGIHTVQELIDMVNQDEQRGEGHEKVLTKIKIDENTIRVMDKQEIRLDSIPDMNQVVWLKENGNLSTGGMAIDRTDEVHPENRRVAEMAAKAIGLDIAGIDMIIPDIAQPLKKGYGAIVEVNAAPGLRMHLFPSEGKKRDVVSPILDMIYSSGSSAEIPIVSVTGTNGKTTTTRMVGHILRKYGLHVGMTTTHGIYIDGQCVVDGDTTGPVSARRVLNDRSVEAAVLETARGGLVRHGLGYSKADVAVFTNLTGDHIGIDGVNTMEDLLWAKSLVIEAVKPHGACILNADDPWIMKAKNRAKGRIILYSLEEGNLHIKEHVEDGGEAFFLKEDCVFLVKSHHVHKVMEVNEISAALKGKLKHNIYNGIAALGAAYALGIPMEAIIEGLKEFTCTPDMNPGRFNIYETTDKKVVLDYGHNLDGYRVTIHGLKELSPLRLIGIIGVPGDRPDTDILEVGRLSGKSFDEIIIREDKDLRGRKPMETAHLLKKGVMEGGMDEEKIQIIPSETEALDKVLSNGNKGDVIVVFFEEREPLIQIVEKYKRKEKTAGAVSTR